MSTSASHDSIRHCAQRPEGQVLLLRPGALGDTILTYPVLAALRQALPQHDILAFGYRAALDLIRPTSIDRARSFDDPALAALFVPDGSSHEMELPDAANVEVAVLWLGEAPAIAERLRRIGIPRVLSVDPRPPEGGGQHMVEHLAGALAPLGIRNMNGIPRVQLGEEGRERGRQILHEVVPVRSGPVVALHAGSGGQRKCWPAERFAELSDRLSREWGAGVLLFCGPADAGPTREVLRGVRAREPVVARGLELADAAALLSQCHAFVGNDSGLSHLAAAVGTPTVAIYGPTDPRVWGVRGERVAWVRAGGTCARPCLDQRTPCACLRELRAGPVLEALLGVLGRPYGDSRSD